MTTKLYTLPQLCAKLGFKLLYEVEEYFVEEQDTLMVSYTNDKKQEILSVGDKIEMDECKCGHSKKSHVSFPKQKKHLNFCEICRIDNQAENIKEFGMGVRHNFKPLLATVKAIRLVEKDKVELELFI